MAPTRTTTPAITFFLFLSLFTASNASSEFVLYSDPPQSMLPNQSLIYDMTPHGIPYGPHKFALRPDCNLVLYNLGKEVWSSNTSRPGGENCYLTLLPDGELVLRQYFHYPVWSSGVKSTPGSYALVLTWDGKIKIYGPELWSNTNETVLSDPEPMAVSADYVLFSYQVTPATYGTLVEFKNFKLELTEECNLVVEDTTTKNILWQTNTYSTAGDCFTYLDESGELFIKHNRREILWSSGTKGNFASYPLGYAMALRYDGRLVIYQPQIWTLGAGNKEGSSMAARSESVFTE